MFRPVFLLSAILAACSPAATEAKLISAEEMKVPDTYKLVWSDEFEVDGLPNPERWGYDTYRNAKGWYGTQKQYYSDARLKNSRVENGRLIIEAHVERLDPETYPDWSGQDYTSARLLTEGLASWTYGYVEVRAKLPCGRGPWPAIWTLPEGKDARWPYDGEIDIMEYVGHMTDTVYATVHTADYNHTNGEEFGAGYTSSTACGDTFHTYSMHWTEETIKMAFDGDHFFTHTKNDEGYGQWPFDRPHHLILNMAIGGWGGTKGIDLDIFPARMEVDYVRIYQRPD